MSLNCIVINTVSVQTVAMRRLFSYCAVVVFPSLGSLKLFDVINSKSLLQLEFFGNFCEVVQYFCYLKLIIFNKSIPFIFVRRQSG